MEYINSLSHFLMDRAFENINESVDYEWDLVNGTEINHNTGAVIDHKNKTVEWLMSSLNKSSNKFKWYKRFLSKISNISPKVKKSILIIIIPIVIGSIGGNSVSDITQEECIEGSVEHNIVANIIDKFPDMAEEKTELANKIKKDSTSIGNESGRTFDDYIKDIAQRESSGNWKVYNKHGYMGLYQIGKLALKDVSQRTKDPKLKDIHKEITLSKFKENPDIFPPELQKKVMMQLLHNRKHYLRKYWKHIGETIGGVELTESGMLAGAHLVGSKSVRLYIKSDGKIDRKDANGIKCSEYMKEFSGYDIVLK